MKILDLISVLENFAPLELQEDYDNSGLLTGSPSWECTGVLCTLDVTKEILQEAVNKNCNLIISHHPLIFHGLKRLIGNSYVEQVVVSAIQFNLAIYAAHTNLDNVIHGVNGMIASKLKLKNTFVLQPKSNMLRKLITFVPLDQAAKVQKAVFEAGGGHIGNYEECSFISEGTGTYKAGSGAHPYLGKLGERHEEKEAKIEIVFPFYLQDEVINALKKHHPYEEVAYDIFSMENVQNQLGAGIVGSLAEEKTEAEFLNLLQHTFQADGIRHSRLNGRMVRTVAVCGGSGSFLIHAAVKKNVDFFITADLKYHDFFDITGKLVLVDIGHYESEQYTVELIHDLLAKKFPTFAILKTNINTNPVGYFKGQGSFHQDGLEHQTHTSN